MEVGMRIKEFRTAKGLTVNKLANLAGVSQSYLRDIELGNKQPTVEYLSYICDALDITLLMFFDDVKENDDFNNAIKKLNPEQKQALADFINKMYK